MYELIFFNRSGGYEDDVDLGYELCVNLPSFTNCDL